MRRRTYAALLAAGFAGCVSSSGGTPSDSPQATHSRDQSPSAGSSTTSSPPPRSETPDPPGESVFAGADCPSVLDACYHEATAESRAYVRPSIERVPPNETVDFTLANRSDVSLFFGPYHWRIWREEPLGWTDLGPDEMLDLGYSLPPSEGYEWTAVVDPAGGEVMPGDRSAEGSTVEFAPGRYCFGIDVSTEDGGESLGTLGALFEVQER